ncbi:hypothetical protein TNCV_3854361 [Trichonephila clavipes]|nr:hypothetical protein TNCV_3854361 [Trichonephila clavipes]
MIDGVTSEVKRLSGGVTSSRRGAGAESENPLMAVPKLRSPIWDIRSSELDAKRPYREVIDTYWNSGKVRGRVSLMRSGIYRAHKEYEASM